MSRRTDDDDGGARRARRVHAAFRVRYRSIAELGLALRHDLARRSLFMCTRRALPVNSVIRVYLELPEGAGTMPVVGRVAFVRGEDEATSSGRPAGAGLELVDLTSEQLASLERLVSERRAQPSTRPEHGSLDIVVADDDASFRQRVVAALRGRGDRVREASDGIEALCACLN